MYKIEFWAQCVLEQLQSSSAGVQKSPTAIIHIADALTHAFEVRSLDIDFDYKKSKPQ